MKKDTEPLILSTKSQLNSKMLYFFSGDDTKQKFSNLEKFISSLPKEIEIFNFSKNNFPGLEIRNFYSGQSLFAGPSLVIFESLLDREESARILLGELESMSESQSHFLFLESKVLKETLDSFRKHRAEINVFELPKAKKEKFNNFLLADAFGAKNKVNLWLYFRQAVDLGVGLEELVGVLFWKAKEMILRRDFSKYTEVDLIKFSSELSYLLPETRVSGSDAETRMERFLLESL